MKKSIFALASAVVLMAASCSNEKKAAEATEPVCEEACVEVYSGVLPAADAEGVLYDLKLEYNEEGVGTYTLNETYMVADTTATNVTVATEGDFVVENKDGKKYIALTKDATKATDEEVNDTIFFLVDSDSTITMVNAELEPAVTDLNYTLNLQK